LTLLCTHHHRLLHEGGFRIEREGDGTLRFVRLDGRTMPRCGYRLEDFVDECCAERPSREGFRTETVHRPDHAVRETAAPYCVRQLRPPLRRLRSCRSD
jgi:hypothetical protein